MYRVGFIPWDGHKLSVRLCELVDGEAALPKGKALDVGCGTGEASIYLARHGWNVTGVDFVKRALEKARVKTERAAVSVRYVHADATRLSSYGLGAGFDLVADNGCMHGLSDAGREAYVRELSSMVAPGGRLVLLGFAEGKRPGPRGFKLPEIRRRFDSGWELIANGVDPGGSNRPGDPIYFYDLRRT
jgi:SAM-dependent methyltransferase